MKAQSADYVALQNIYKSKARRDVEEVTATIRQLESQLGRSTPQILEREIEVFCKNAAQIKVVHGRSIPQISSDSDSMTLKAIRSQLNMPGSLIPVFIATQILDAVVDEIQSSGQGTQLSIDDDGLWTSHTERILALLSCDQPVPLDEDVREGIDKAIAIGHDWYTFFSPVLWKTALKYLKGFCHSIEARELLPRKISRVWSSFGSILTAMAQIQSR